MVFQANKKIKIFGKCKKHVEIKVEFLDQVKKIRTTDHQFEIELDAENYQDKSFSFSLSCKKQKETIYNCMMGDVYFFMGGKNLFQTIAMSSKIKDYDSDDIRFINLMDKNQWIISSRDSLNHISVLSYLFAKNFHLLYKIPLGIVIYPNPEETIFSWLNESMVMSNIDMKNYINGVFQQNDMHLAKDYTTIQNRFSQIHVNGVVFYQGENDFPHFHLYEKALNYVVRTYRTIFKDIHLPFYIIQMSSFEGKKDCKIASSEIRIAQSRLADNKQNIFVVSVVDVDEHQLVSLNKNMLSIRLANCVLEKQYKKGKHTLCPQFFSYKKRKDQIDIYTHQNFLSLVSRSGQKLGFYGVNKDLDHYPIKDVDINNNQISLKINEDFQEIRYAYDDNPTCDIFTSNGLPLLPFKITL
jgi:sialate O-acetylesterase